MTAWRVSPFPRVVIAVLAVCTIAAGRRAAAQSLDAVTMQERYAAGVKAANAGDFNTCLSITNSVLTLAPGEARFVELREACEAKRSTADLDRFQERQLPFRWLFGFEWRGAGDWSFIQHTVPAPGQIPPAGSSGTGTPAQRVAASDLVGTIGIGWRWPIARRFYMGLGLGVELGSVLQTDTVQGWGYGGARLEGSLGVMLLRLGDETALHLDVVPRLRAFASFSDKQDANGLSPNAGWAFEVVGNLMLQLRSVNLGVSVVATVDGYPVVGVRLELSGWR